MTTDLEKQFFDTFGIEAKALFSTRNGYTDDMYYYPPITDRILLELILIVMNYYYEVDFSEFDVNDINGLKDSVLELMIEFADPEDFHEGVYEQVQALFKE